MMPHFRKDPFGNAWVLMSPERGLQASDFGSAQAHSPVSPLSPDGEAELRELYALRPSGGTERQSNWRVRVVEAPVSLQPDKLQGTTEEGLFRYASGESYLEMVIEHPEARMTLEAMDQDHLVDVLRIYRDRMALHARREGIRHVQLSRSVGTAAGAQFEHPHGQVLAVPVPNRWLEEELTAARAHHGSSGSCLYCDVIGAESRDRQRLITQNEHFVAVAPFAAKQPFETWVLPRRHAASFTTEPSNFLPQLAQILQSVLRALDAALDTPPYNLVMHTLPAASDVFHWHIEILPRLTRQSGFDWGVGFYVNPTPPEHAARFLREALALEEVGI